MLFIYSWLNCRLTLCRQDNRAVTAIEYALIAALIAVVIIAAVSGAGKGVSATFTKVATEL